MEWFAQAAQFLRNFGQTISISDFVDVAVIAYLIYRLMLLVRRTSAVNVAKAIVLLIAALWVSDIFHLDAVNFILGRTVELGVLALIIVFQPEIRRVLELLGSNRINIFGREEESTALESAIDQTVAAYTALSKDKVGALIVFERKNLLDDVIQTGTALDCSVSAELLKNLFWNKAPLHDGAVIVRNGRIVGAGCMLPMSGNVNLSRDLGMRHRAGIGVSERTDAVAAIVSEETGAISVAVGGMLKRHLAPETLERLLRNELVPVEDTEQKRTAFFTNWLKSKKGGEGDGEKRKDAE